jgi:hypothetical protein
VRSRVNVGSTFTVVIPVHEELKEATSSQTLAAS